MRVGGVVFNHRARGRRRRPTTDREALRAALREAMKPSGGTATGDALATSLEMLAARGNEGARARSSCSPTARRRTGATRCRSPTRPSGSASRSTPSRSARASGTLPNGDAGAAGHGDAAARSPTRSGGEAFTADQAGALSAVYEKLGSEVATKREKREVTGAFAGGAAVLLLLGGGLSLRWFRRLV